MRCNVTAVSLATSKAIRPSRSLIYHIVVRTEGREGQKHVDPVLERSYQPDQVT